MGQAGGELEFEGAVGRVKPASKVRPAAPRVVGRVLEVSEKKRAPMRLSEEALPLKLFRGLLSSMTAYSLG